MIHSDRGDTLRERGYSEGGGEGQGIACQTLPPVSSALLSAVLQRLFESAQTLLVVSENITSDMITTHL